MVTSGGGAAANSLTAYDETALCGSAFRYVFPNNKSINNVLPWTILTDTSYTSYHISIKLYANSSLLKDLNVICFIFIRAILVHIDIFVNLGC